MIGISAISIDGHVGRPLPTQRVARPIMRRNPLCRDRPPKPGPLWVVAVVVIAGCGDGLAEPLQSAPYMDQLWMESSVYHGITPPEGVLRVGGWVGDATFVVAASSEFEIALESSSGDREITGLRKSLCGPSSAGDWWLCDRLIVEMEVGYAPGDIYYHVRAYGARFTSVSPLGLSAGIQLFDHSLDQALRDSRRWPGVEQTYYGYVGFLEDVPPQEIASRRLTAPIRLDPRPPILRNGVLEAYAGDTIRAIYSQPDGSVLTHMWVLPGS